MTWDHRYRRATAWLHEGAAMLPIPAKLPIGSHLILLLLLIAGVIVPTASPWRSVPAMPILSGHGVALC